MSEQDSRPATRTAATLARGIPPVAAALVVEVVGAVVGDPHPVATGAALLLYLSFAAVVAAWSMGVALGMLRGVRASWPPGGMPAAAAVSGVWVVLVIALQRRLQTFNNRELAGLLFALLTLLLAVGLALGFLAGVRRLGRASREQRRWVSAAVTAVAAVGIGYAVLRNREGLVQLEPSLLLTPVAAGAVLLASRGLPRPQIGKRVGWLVTALAFAGAWSAGALNPQLPRALLDAGSWGALGIRALHVATDFDRDGYSSLAGGGDCAPFDSEVNPNAREVPADGVDNNCFGGDASPYKALRPTWVSTPKAKRHNVVYVTVEALRPDHLSFLGYERDTTPNLSKIAKKAVVFERAYAPSTLTRWSLTSIFSTLPASRVPFVTPRTGAERFELGKGLPWLPSILKGAGYRTAAIVPNFGMLSKEGIGLDRGFESYDSETPITYRGGSMQGFPGEQQVARASRLLDKFRRKKTPFFLWLHLVEPHFRYDLHPDAPRFGNKPQDLYDSEIWTADQRIGELWEKLGELDLQEDTIFIVSGDHGEEFSEHGKRFHGSNLFEPQVRTLLLMRIPKHKGRRVAAPVNLNEIPPALLNVLGLKKDFERLRSRNVLPLVNGADHLPGQVTVELFDGWRHSSYQVAMLEGQNKVMWSEIGNFSRTFDLQSDPQERSPIAAPDPEQERLMQQLHEYVEGAAKRSDGHEQR
jgi:arylsulfatase A-like enzyme